MANSRRNACTGDPTTFKDLINILFTCVNYCNALSVLGCVINNTRSSPLTGLYVFMDRIVSSHNYLRCDINYLIVSHAGSDFEFWECEWEPE
jgi:hypothetical protein